MHSSEQKQQFVLLRSQGWSLARIAGHLDIPKGTLWRWDHEKHDQLQVLKAVRFEEIQEKFIPTYEEELQQLAAYRDRIRKVLQHQDFGWMKPEFLLKMDLQITSRLAKFRAELPLHDLPKTDPVSLPGCVSRDELKPDAAPVASHHASAPAENGTFRYEEKRDHSSSTTYNEKNGTVPFSTRPPVVNSHPDFANPPAP